MKRSLDGFSGLDSSPPHRYVPMFPPSAFANPLLSNEAPHHPAWSTARIPATVVKARRLDQCSLFAMICWTFSPVVHSYLPFLSLSLHCAVTTEHSPCFFTPLYLCLGSYPSCIVFISFPHCFPYTFQLLPRRILSFSYLCRSSSLFLCVSSVATYQVSSS